MAQGSAARLLFSTMARRFTKVRCAAARSSILEIGFEMKWRFVDKTLHPLAMPPAFGGTRLESAVVSLCGGNRFCLRCRMAFTTELLDAWLIFANAVDDDNKWTLVYSRAGSCV